MRDQKSILKITGFLIALFTITLELIFPLTADLIKYPALAICLLLVGIPHGAIDHIVSSSLYDLSKTIYDQSKFYIYYLIMMALMAAIWIFNPLAGFLVFALLTIYHFGQADLVHLNIDQSIKRFLFISRGSMIMGLILISDPLYTLPILIDITGLNLTGNLSGAYFYPFLITLLPAQYILSQAAIMFYQKLPASQILYSTLDSLLVATLFIVVNPILAFSVYFGFWHAAGHVQEMLNYFTLKGEKMDLKSFYKKAFPLNLITFLGMGLIYWMSQLYNFELQIVSLLFIIISVLTLPHMLIVEKMYGEVQRYNS